MFRNRASSMPKKEETKSFSSPLQELNHLLDSLDTLIESSMNEYVESIRPPAPEGKARRSSVLDSLKKFRGSRSSSLGDDPAIATSTPAPTTTSGNATGRPPSAPNSGVSSRSSGSYFNTHKNRWEEQDAKFVPMSSERVADYVETIRRVAELVIIGERSHGKDDAQAQEYMAIFDTFFERQGLATITNILTGNAFDLMSHPVVIQQLNEPTELYAENDETLDEDAAPRRPPIALEEHEYRLLPPLPIATQAIQSVSILVQNVSRATSLFFILSNNHVTQLIGIPLDLYQMAERRNTKSADTSRRFASPELAELTTHVVTFLKSLALRMNAETLQFFLTYPSDVPTDDVEDIIVLDTTPHFDNPQDNVDEDEDRPMDETPATAQLPAPNADRPVSVKTVKVEFPLYERALEFCSAHQDSFIRVTAMNICLNTLRLATVTPMGDEEDDDGADLGKSPDGVLHNAKPLPLKERVAIAQYVCTPARVERLASPIFTKLAQLWGVLEEQFRDMDGVPTRSTSQDEGEASSTAASSKVARAKEKARRQKASDSFNDTAYNVQDELLLLEDVLKVGLTSLNEQMIEMMFATFVYPLLLQPLLLYFQRSPVPDEVLFADPLNDHTAGRPIGDSDVTATENAIISAPAKSAIFCLTAAFSFLTNPPLLRLLFTALFHPLAPEATGETMIRAKADVACLDPDGKVQIRIDPVDVVGGAMKTMTDRSTYVFGAITGQKCSSSNSKNASKSETSCVFVLAPALSEILEFRGNDASLVARTRQNPYRKAIFKCFSLCSQLSDLRPMSILAVETAVSKFPAKFLSDILFGTDLQKFQDNLPLDERSSNSYLAQLDDRDIGGGTMAGQSRHTLGDAGTGRIGHGYRSEVLSAFRSCILRAMPAGKGSWELEYDLAAAHALLCIIRGDPEALLEAAKRIDKRCRQGAAFLSDIPHSVERFAGSKLSKIVTGLGESKPRDGTKIEGTIMDILFRGYGDIAKSPCVLNDLVEFKSMHRVADLPGYGVKVTESSTYAEMCARCCAFPPLDGDEAEGALRTAMSSARAWVKLGKNDWCPSFCSFGGFDSHCVCSCRCFQHNAQLARRRQEKHYSRLGEDGGICREERWIRRCDQERHMRVRTYFRTFFESFVWF